MTVHQRFGPPGYEFHPELGYLCPSQQLRQNVRVGLAAAAFGLIAGAAATVVLLPRHSGDLTRAEPALASAAADPVRDSTPVTTLSSSIASPRVPSGSAERGAVKQPPPAAAARLGTDPNFSPNAASPAVEAPAAPVVTTDRGTAVGASEPVRAGASKRTRTAHSVARRRYREPAPTDAFATSPFGLQTSRFADETRSTRRRDWGGYWRW
jgi:hypothetical protein